MVSRVHRLRSSDRIFFVTANLRRVLTPLAENEYGLVMDALADSRRKKNPRHKTRVAATRSAFHTHGFETVSERSAPTPDAIRKPRREGLPDRRPEMVYDAVVARMPVLLRA